MDTARMKDYIQTNKQQFLDQLFTLLRQRSISTQNDGIEECAELLQGMMQEIGIDTKILPTAGHPVVYGELVHDPDAFTLLIYGHYDVQPPEPYHAWESPPFEPEIRNGKIYARGVGDNKGQLMAQLFGVKSYQETVGNLPINIKFVFEGEEEKGSTNLAAFVEEHKNLLQADLVYTSDGPSHNSSSPLVLLGVRGMLSVEFRAKGADRDNHSGNTGNIVPNPAWKLIELMHTMREADGHVKIEGFYDNIRAFTPYEEQLLTKLPYDKDSLGKKIGYPALSLDGPAYYQKMTGEPTFNIYGMESGYTGEGTKTIIPATAKIKMDIRLVVDQDPLDILEKIKKHVETYAPDIEVTYLGSMQPSRTKAELPIVQKVVSAVEAAYQTEPLIQPSMGGSLPDYVWTKILGLPSVIVPYANFDQHNHSPNENLDVEYFLNGIHCTASVIHTLCKTDI
jgi:acetylornithine deacetylase/succinyl-diaminopimelate desuccinylase-like protein